MQSGVVLTQLEAVPNREPDPVSQDPQPKSKKEDLGPLIQALLKVLSCMQQLQVQSHLIHFNYESPNFLSVHKQLKKQYELHLDQFDHVGELVRSLDYMTVMCQKGLLGCHKDFKHCKSYNPKEMLCTYISNLEDAGMLAKKLSDVARKAKAPDVEHYAAQLVGEMFESAWLFKAVVRRM